MTPFRSILPLVFLAACATTAGYVRQILEQKHPTGHIGNLEREVPRGLSLGPVEPGNSDGYRDIFSDQLNEQNEESDNDNDNDNHSGDA